MINAKIIDQDTTGVPGGFCCKNPVDQYMTGAKNPAVLIVDQDTTGVPKDLPILLVLMNLRQKIPVSGRFFNKK